MKLLKALSPLFVKVWRMCQLLDASIVFKRKNITNFQSFLYTLPLFFVEMLILLVFSLIDPPRPTEELGVGNVGVGEQVISCQHRTDSFFITQTIFAGKYESIYITYFRPYVLRVDAT
jgi:hypothetical protein